MQESSQDLYLRYDTEYHHIKCIYVNISLKQILAQCSSLTQDTLDKTNMSKMIARFSKRANETIKSLIDKLEKNVATASSSKKLLSASDTTSNASIAATVNRKDAKQQLTASGRPASANSLEKAPGGNITGVKRARNNDMPTMQSAKRVSSGVANNSSSSFAAGKRVGSISNGKSIGAGTSTSTSSQVNVVSKPKGNQVIAKPTNFFSSLQPALKKNAVGVTSGGSASVEAQQQKAITTMYVRPLLG